MQKVVSILLVLAMVVCLLPVLSTTSTAATGYDRGYSGGMAGDGYIRAYGIDVSEHQGVGFNFQNLKNNGYSFVILRAGFVTRKDYRFEEYYAAAKAAGLNVGVYFYSYASNASEAANEADRCLSYIAGKQFEYPVYFDFEDASARSYNGNTAYSLCRAFMDKIAAAGYLTGLYGYASWLDPNYGAWVPTSSICGGKYECWMANYYNDSPTNARSASYPSTYGMYQYTSSNYVGGVGPLDTNVCYKDYPSIVKQYGFNGYSANSASSENFTDGAVFNADYYRENNYDLRNMTNDQLKEHWLNYGIKEGRRASAAFDVKYYLNTYSDLRNAYGTDYKSAMSHFLSFGMKEGRSGASGFDFNFYKANNIDLRAAFGDDNASYYRHYANWGYKEGRNMTRLTPVIDGVYKIYSALNKDYALNIAGDSQDNQANLQLWDKRAAHNIVIQSTGDGFYTLRVEYSGKYIEVYGNYTDNGSNVSQFTGNGTNAQKWSIKNNGDGTFSFFACTSGKAMDVTNGQAGRGSNIQLYQSNGTAAQKWVLEVQKTVNDGVYELASASDNGRTLHVNGGSTQNDVDMVLWEREDVIWEKLAVEYVGDGYYTLRMLSANKYLTAEGTTAGNSIMMRAQNNADSQKWRIVPNGDGSYQIVSKLATLRMDRNGNGSANGTKIIAWTPNGNPAQNWSLIPTTTDLDGVYQIRSAANSNYAIDVQSQSKDAANVLLWTAGDSTSQQFVIQSVMDGQWYTIRNVNSGRVLNVDHSRSDNGTNVLQYSTGDTSCTNELWSIIPQADGTVRIVSAATGATLEFAYGDQKAANGKNVEMWESNNGKNQRWILGDRIDPIAEGAYKMTAYANANFSLDEALSTSNAHLFSTHTGSNQVFYFEKAGKGYYRVRSIYSGKYLDLNDNNPISGHNVSFVDGNGSEAQMWIVVPNYGGSFTLMSKKGGKALDINGGTMSDRTNVQIWSANRTVAQRWTLTSNNLNGWVKEYGGQSRYFVNNKLADGWTCINNVYYYFNKGVVATGWISTPTAVHHFADDGAAHNGWTTIDGKKYCFDSEGVMRTGWYKEGNTSYFLKADGTMADNEWIYTGGKYYFLQSGGAMVTGTKTIEGRTYTFGSDGALK